MSKFNQALKIVQRALVGHGPDRLNRGGGLAFSDTPRLALYRQVATSLWSGDGYYERQAEWFKRFQDNVAAALAEDVRFPFALAAYARDKRGLALRTSALAVYVEAVAHPATKGSGLARRYAPRVLRRADEPAEAIAYFKTHHTGVVPHGLLRGIQDALRGFDAYQLAKHKGTGAVTLRDVLRLSRPKPATEAERELWGLAVGQDLPAPDTWEVEISAATGVAGKREAWNRLIVSGKLGVFALVRNLRNIAEAGADIEAALEQITPERSRGSGIMPFQWYKAYTALLTSHGEALAAPLQTALEVSLADVEKLPGTTLVACDNSSSMSTVRPTRGMTAAEIANLMGALAVFVSERALAGTFGETFALADVNPHHGLFYNKAEIDKTGKTTGHATNAWRVIEFLSRERIKVDRVILFSDMQCYDSNARFAPGAVVSRSLSAELDSYLQFNPAARVYSVNLASNDNSTQFAPSQPVIELAGFSESLFRFIAAMEVGDSVIDEILSNY